MRVTQDADFAVLPADWKHYLWTNNINLAYEFAEKMFCENKKLVVQFYSDLDERIRIKNAIILRTSFKFSKRLKNEYVMPGFVGDPLTAYHKGVLPIRTKNQNPKVGFCGWAKESSLESFALVSFLSNSFEYNDMRLKNGKYSVTPSSDKSSR